MNCAHATLIAVFLAAFPSAAAEPPHMFDVVFRAPSLLDVSGANPEFTDFAMAVRNKGDANSSLAIDAKFHELVVVEHHLAWTAFHDPTGGEPQNLPPDVDTATPGPVHRDGRLTLQAIAPWTSAALVADHVLSLDDVRLQAQGVHQRPYLADSAITSRTVVEPNSDERHVWQLNGSFHRLVPQTLDATFSGNTSLYWHHADAVVTGPQATTVTYQSRAWTEVIDPLQRSERKHVVWHTAEMTTKQASLGVLVGDATHAANYARSFTIPRATDIAVDAASMVEGALPAESTVNGSAVWITGMFHVTSDVDQSEGTPRSVVRVAGSATAFSVAGGAPTFPRAAVAGVSALGLLMAALYAFRSSVAQFGLRIFLPLYSLLKPEAVLEQPTRAAIFRMVQQSDGIAFEQLRRFVANPETGRVGNGTLLYHLWRLEQHKLVRSQLTQGERVYYEASRVSAAIATFRAALAGEPARRLGHAIMQQPGAAQKDLLRFVGGTPSTARQRCKHHLAKLIQVGLVVEAQEGRLRRYYPGKALSSALVDAASGPADEAPTGDSRFFGEGLSTPSA